MEELEGCNNPFYTYSEASKIEPAFPRNYDSDGHNGLTKREYFAARFMQAYATKGIARLSLMQRIRLFLFGASAKIDIIVTYGSNETIAKQAVDSADALIEALNR